jgi:hypothetical protein
MAGISFLYAVWHSPAVRAHLVNLFLHFVKCLVINILQTLDDFDFTVLAATSVLGDLMEKCPPADACREAFERMSKATVQMCMSTPGFGFSAEREEPSQSRVALSRQPSFQSMSTSMNIDSYPHIAPKPQPRRPPPKFDMNLKDLFPEDLEPSTRPSHSFPMAMQSHSRQQQEQGPFQSPTQSHRQQPSPRQPQLSPALSINSQINSSLGVQPSGTNPLFYDQQFQQQQQPFYMQNRYNPDFMSSIPGMDFLDNGTSGPDDDFNFETTGLDLGFGMGLDLQHDWSDGQQYDLFDGFFFGNGNGNANGNG